MNARSLFAPGSANGWRGRMFAERRARWRESGERHHAPHAAIEPFAPALLVAMFDGGLRVVGPAREYAYRVEAHGQTVRLNAETWFWYAMDGTAEGVGFYELWAWRFGLPVEDAHAEMWATINAEAEAACAAAPKKAG